MGSLLQLPQDSRLSRMEGPKVAGSPQGEGTALRSPQAGLLQEQQPVSQAHTPSSAPLPFTPTSSALKMHPEPHSPTIWATTSSCPDDHLGPQTGLPASTFQQWVLNITARDVLLKYKSDPWLHSELSRGSPLMQKSQVLGIPTCSLTLDPPTLTAATLATPLLPSQEPPCPRAFACSWACYALP